MTHQIQTEHLDAVLKNHAQDMSAKVVAITGTTTGTGYICARETAKKGATALLLNRKSERSEKAHKELLASVPDGKFDPIACDLQSFASVKNAVEEIKSKYAVIDVLVNNAGVMAIPYRQTADGFEMQIGTNHFGHFALTAHLIDLLQKTPNSRVVTVSSFAHILPDCGFCSTHTAQLTAAFGRGLLQLHWGCVA